MPCVLCFLFPGFAGIQGNIIVNNYADMETFPALAELDGPFGLWLDRST